MRRLTALLLLLCLSTIPHYAQAAERHALVIGNSDYLVQPLANPRNDATDVASELRKMGYRLHEGRALLDLNRRDIVRALVTFADALPNNADVLFYYAGHGMSVGRDNFLIPVGHQLEAIEQLPDQAISLRFVLERLKNANPQGTNVVLLDACRDNPLTGRYRSLRAGLSTEQEIPRGVFIGYAADSGQVAIDGEGRNGVYTAELLNVMRNRSDVIIDVAHREAADAVIEKTGGQQFPVSENKLYGKWCFNQCATNPQTPGTALQQTAPQTPAQTQELTQSAFQEPAPQPQADSQKSTSRTGWLIAGGVALALLAVLAAGNSDDPPANNFSLVLDPP